MVTQPDPPPAWQAHIDAEVAAAVTAEAEVALQAGFDFGTVQPRARLAALDAAAVLFCRSERRTHDATLVAWWGFRCGYVAATGRMPWLRRTAAHHHEEES